MKIHKTAIKTVFLAICAMAVSSCSIVRGLRADGKDGPNIFSFEQREVDTIANGNYTFHFPVAQRRAEWIDTLHFYAKPHRCEDITGLEALNAKSGTQVSP